MFAEWRLCPGRTDAFALRCDAPAPRSSQNRPWKQAVIGSIFLFPFEHDNFLESHAHAACAGGVEPVNARRPPRRLHRCDQQPLPFFVLQSPDGWKCLGEAPVCIAMGICEMDWRLPGAH